MPHKLFVQISVVAAVSNKFFVATLFDDLAIFEDDDAMGVANSGKAMRDDETSAAREKFFERMLDGFFGGGINGACGLVEDQNVRPRDHRSREGE